MAATNLPPGSAPDSPLDTSAQIETVFTRLADQAGDITGPVIQRYFDRCRDSQTLMEHMDEHMLGRMMDQVLLLIMESGDAELASYLAFETSTHEAYGVNISMYEQLMGAVVDVTAGSLGDDFEGRAALESRIRYLLEQIETATTSENEL